MEELQGTIERITFTNPENGFTIARARVKGRRSLVTMVGHLPGTVPGQEMVLRGAWTNHPRYGEQFRVDSCREIKPTTLRGIEKYLGSGLIRGLGPETAARIVNCFGERTLEVIETDPEALARVPGIGRKRVAMIQAAWADQQQIRDLIVYLQGHGIGGGFAARIFRQYGSAALETVRENPYRLAMEVSGIGFQTADQVARKTGFPPDCPERAQAGLLYVLQEMNAEGHVYCPYEALVGKCTALLEVDREVVVRAFAAVAARGDISIEDINDGGDPERVNNKAVYPAALYKAETGVAALIRRLLATPKSYRPPDPAAAIGRVEKELGITLAAKQVEAVNASTRHKMLVITGGPGTGKTTIINAILKTFRPLGLPLMMAAPTGRAAKRMTETTGLEARTIHRLLEYNMQKGAFLRNSRHPLTCELLIIDEASMIDITLCYHLLRALPERATLILVGDVNQLPSVGAGNVLGDIIASRAAPVIELNEIFRQAQRSSIVVNAHLINKGVMPRLTIFSRQADDFYLVPQSDPDKVLEWIVNLVARELPARFGLDPVNDIQVLTPMHRGTVGSENLNEALRRALNPDRPGISRGGVSYAPGDKVMQIRNNYDRDVFNGDIGRVAGVNTEDQSLTVNFDQRLVPYGAEDLDDLVPAYAVSVHKAQGSEYPAVIIPLLTQHYVMLQRNLLYTAVTRGRRLVIIVGARQALAIALNNDRTARRHSRLKQRLAGGGAATGKPALFPEPAD